MYQMVYAVRDDMQNAYPELRELRRPCVESGQSTKKNSLRGLLREDPEWNRLIVQKIGDIQRELGEFKRELALSASPEIAMKLKAQRLDVNSSELTSSAMLDVAVPASHYLR